MDTHPPSAAQVEGSDGQPKGKKGADDEWRVAFRGTETACEVRAQEGEEVPDPVRDRL